MYREQNKLLQKKVTCKELIDNFLAEKNEGNLMPSFFFEETIHAPPA